MEDLIISSALVKRPSLAIRIYDDRLYFRRIHGLLHVYRAQLSYLKPKKTVIIRRLPTDCVFMPSSIKLVRYCHSTTYTLLLPSLRIRSLVRI